MSGTIKLKILNRVGIGKTFLGLPDEVSIGNPTFFKNSPYIIAFDYQNPTSFVIVGANIETGDLGVILQ